MTTTTRGTCSIPSNPLTGGPTGTVYRVHTTGTDPANVAQQRSTDGEQSFAIYATDTAPGGVLPKVYGLGAMQMFTPLSADSTPPDSVSTFYLAQIDPIHAGKTLELHLWDPGRYPVTHRGPGRPDPVVHDGCLERHAVLLFSEGRDVRFRDRRRPATPTAVRAPRPSERLAAAPSGTSTAVG